MSFCPLHPRTPLRRCGAVGCSEMLCKRCHPCDASCRPAPDLEIDCTNCHPIITCTSPDCSIQRFHKNCAADEFHCMLMEHAEALSTQKELTDELGAVLRSHGLPVGSAEDRVKFFQNLLQNGLGRTETVCPLVAFRKIIS